MFGAFEENYKSHIIVQLVRKQSLKKRNSCTKIKRWWENVSYNI